MRRGLALVAISWVYADPSPSPVSVSIAGGGTIHINQGLIEVDRD
jgi:hypothetical protein